MLVDIAQQVGPLVNVDLHGEFYGPSRMDIGGKIIVGINENLNLGPLGHLLARFDVNGALTAGIQNNSPFARFQGGFEFEKWNFELPAITLAIDGQELGHIIETVAKQVVSVLTHDLLADAAKWLDLVRQGLIEGIKEAEQIARVLRNAYHYVEKQVIEALHQIGKAANDIGKALKEIFGATAQEATNLLKDVLHLGSDATTAVLKAAGYAVQDAEHAASNAFNWVASKVNPSNW
jgi:hypothetical protein